MKAVWRGATLAVSDATVVIEGNHYFPPDSVSMEYFAQSETRTICPWKGEASYYNVEVDGQTNMDVAWYYPETSGLAKAIKGHIAFWKGVEIGP